MSMRSWKKEYYPVEAAKVPKELAVVASLRKWIGLRLDNLQRHGLVKGGLRVALLKDLSDYESCVVRHLLSLVDDPSLRAAEAK